MGRVGRVGRVALVGGVGARRRRRPHPTSHVPSLPPSPPPNPACAQDEYWTSQKCHKCEQFLADGKGHRTKVCTNPACEDHGQAFNRDLNAARNLQRVWDEWLAHRRRPGYLTAPDDAEGEEGEGPDSAGDRDAKTTAPKAKTSSKAKAAGASDATAKDGAARAKASAHPGAM